MILLSDSDADIRKASDMLRKGMLVAFPTETVYGLGADAFNTRALARVFEAKGRPRFDPLIIHIAEPAALDRIARLDALDPGRRALLQKLISSFWPGPLTLILPKRNEVPDLATAGLPTAAIRFPGHAAAQALIRLSTGAVAAPSANPFGRLSPTRAEHVAEGLGERVDCIIDGGPARVGVESTVLDLSSGPPRILRYGGITREALEALIGPVETPPLPGGVEVKRPVGTDVERDRVTPAGTDAIHTRPSPAGDRALLSPGNLEGHYAPGTPLVLHSPGELAALAYVRNEGYLFFSGAARDAWLSRNPGADPPHIVTLSEGGGLPEAAANLFECLHRLDRLGLACIHVETLPPEGLGAAVNDRLSRADRGSHIPGKQSAPN